MFFILLLLEKFFSLSMFCLLTDILLFIEALGDRLLLISDFNESVLNF